MASGGNSTSFESIGEVIRARESFCVLSHLRPDGDATGSQLALGLSLRAMGKKVHIVNEDGLPNRFAFLPGSETILLPPYEPLDVEVTIACDTATEARLGDKARAAGSKADTWINIDHHVSNERYGDLVYVDDHSPATGQILYELLEECGFPLTADICQSLFVAMSTDTGSFQFPSTTAKSYRIAAAMIERGIDVGSLSAATYNNFPFRRTELLRELLNVLKLSGDGKVGSWVLSREVIDRLGIQPEDTESLIDHIRSIEGVVVAAFFEELEEGRVRISLRSKDPRADVCKICAVFGGGGHRLASGARAKGSLKEVEEKVLTEIERVIHGYN